MLAVLTAIANLHRLRIIAALRGGRMPVSELARRLGIPRPLLALHLDRLAKAGLLTSRLELSADEKPVRYAELAPFELRLTVDTISRALHAGDDMGHPGQTPGYDRRVSGT